MIADARQFLEILFLAVAAILPIVNPLAGAPVFLVKTADLAPEERRTMAMRVARYGFALLLASALIGAYVLEGKQVSTRIPLKADTEYAFIGGGDAFPTVFNAKALGRLVGAPYVPITAYLLPVPLPVPLAVHYGEPIIVEGTGNEDDATIEHHVETVKARIGELLEHGERVRSGTLPKLGGGA